MARFVSSLVFLILSLYCCRSQSQRSKINIRLTKGSPLVEGAKVELECLISEQSLSDSGVSWMRQDKDAAPQFILFISSLGRVAQTENKEVVADFDGKKESNNYRLILKSFKKQDQGYYYCIVNRNQMLHFSSGHGLYLPVPSTKPPTTKAATTTQPRTSHSKELGGCTESSSREKPPKKGLDFSCELYIWVPLVGACFLLFTALLATIIVCRKTRRRRCKCKRPLNGANGKAGMSNSYV